jgi:hypothetical protein
MSSFGYAIINFISHEIALRFGELCSDRNLISAVEWSSQLQGLEKHVQRYRNSPMMHPELSDQLKPMLFSGGVRICFPAATQTLKMPRRRSRGNEDAKNKTPNPRQGAYERTRDSQASFWYGQRPR